MSGSPGSRESARAGRGVRALAPAKVNLCLKILGRRPDGYHEISTLFQAVSLFDEIELIEAGAAEPAEAIPGETAWTAPDGLRVCVESPWPVPCDESNLVTQAIRLVAAETGREAGRLRLRLRKRIPPGGGLGGGSADAAAALRALDALWGLETPRERLLEWAARLGSDPPFFLLGGAAIGPGRGEKLTPVDNRAIFWMTLVKPAVSISTAEAYRAFDPGRHAAQGGVEELAQALGEGRIPRAPELWQNTFERLLAARYPELEQARRDLLEAGMEVAALSGSGACVWGLTQQNHLAGEAAGRLRDKYPWARAVEPVRGGIEIQELSIPRR